MAEPTDEAMGPPQFEPPQRRDEKDALSRFIDAKLGGLSNPGTPMDLTDEVDHKGRKDKGKSKGPGGPKGQRKGEGRLAREKVQNSLSEVPLGFSEAKVRAALAGDETAQKDLDEAILGSYQALREVMERLPACSRSALATIQTSVGAYLLPTGMSARMAVQQAIAMRAGSPAVQPPKKGKSDGKGFPALGGPTEAKKAKEPKKAPTKWRSITEPQRVLHQAQPVLSLLNTQLGKAYESLGSLKKAFKSIRSEDDARLLAASSPNASEHLQAMREIALLRAKQWATQEYLAQCTLANVPVDESAAQKVADQTDTRYWGQGKSESKKKPLEGDESTPAPKRSRSEESGKASRALPVFSDEGGEMVLDLTHHIRTNIHEASPGDLRNHLARMRTLKGQMKDGKFRRTSSHESMEVAMSTLDSHIAEGENRLATLPAIAEIGEEAEAKDS